jgi:tripartite-type tricarboxylate transporter receptor subunit TctC
LLDWTYRSRRPASGGILQHRQQCLGFALLTVPYTGGPAAALGDVGSGRVSMIIEGYSGIVGSVKAGQVRLIAVASIGAI